MNQICCKLWKYCDGTVSSLKFLKWFPFPPFYCGKIKGRSNLNSMRAKRLSKISFNIEKRGSFFSSRFPSSKLKHKNRVWARQWQTRLWLLRKLILFKEHSFSNQLFRLERNLLSDNNRLWTMDRTLGNESQLTFNFDT